MAAPIQMTAETLNALKGWPHQYALDFSTKLASTVDAIRVPAGACVSLDANAQFILGVGTTDRMPMFLFTASDAPDAKNDGGNAATDKGVFIAISPVGNLMALVALGAYELVSTHFDRADVANYVPNAPLTSPEEPSDDAGKLVIGVIGTDTVVGIVSRGIVDNGYGTTGVAFWPVFLPTYA